MLQAYPYQSDIQAPVTSAVEDKGEESTSGEVNENLDIDLGSDFDFTQSLLTKLSWGRILPTSSVEEDGSSIRKSRIKPKGRSRLAR